MAKPSEVNVGRPGYFEQVAASCVSDFLAYEVFVHGRLPAEHQLVIAERLLAGTAWELILAPPGVGKSTLGADFIEWQIGRDPDQRWLIASEVSGQIASTLTAQIGETLASNERYSYVFGGPLKDPRGRGEWSSMALRCRTHYSAHDASRLREPATPAPPPWLLRPETHKPPQAVPINPNRGRKAGLRDPNVRAVSWGSGYTGARVDGIMADDLVSNKVSRSDEMTDHVFDTLHTKMLTRFELGKPQRAIVFGQHWSPRDLYSRLRQRGCVVYDNDPEGRGAAVLDEQPAVEEAV